MGGLLSSTAAAAATTTTTTAAEVTQLDEQSRAKCSCHECGAGAAVEVAWPAKRRWVPACAACGVRARGGEVAATARDRVAVEAGLVEYAAVDVDTWALSSWHAPGNMAAPGLWVFNRTLVFRLRVGGESFLVAVNPGRIARKDDPASPALPEPVAALVRLSQRTKCPLKFVMSVDYAHNMFLAQWADILARDGVAPQAKVLYPKGRIDRELPHLHTLKNVQAINDASPETRELAAAGLELFLWRGAAERDMELNGRQRGTVEGFLLWFPTTKTLFFGPHFVWVDAPTTNSGFVFRRLVGFQSGPTMRAIATVGVKSMLTYPLWNPDAFRVGLDRVLETIPWEFAADFHVAPNQVASREELLPSLRAAYAHVTDKTREASLFRADIVLPDVTA